MASYCFREGGARYLVLHYGPKGELEGATITHSMGGAKQSRRQHESMLQGRSKIVDVQQLTELEEADETMR